MVHSVEDDHSGESDSSVMYIPVVPLSSYNIHNLVAQRAAFLAGIPPPDMAPRKGEEHEKEHDDRGTENDILTKEGRRILGLEKWDVGAAGITEGQRRIRQLANEMLGY